MTMPDDPDRPARRSQIAERITVNLTNRASESLTAAMELSRDTKTDSLNKALTAYAELLRIQAAGGACYIRTEPDAELERIRFL